MRQPVTLAAQIEELGRLLSFRQATDPGRIRGREISPAVSELQLARIEGALKTLRFVKANEVAIRAAVGTLPWEVRA